MKNCWEILGINPTTDLDAINNAKRALLENSNSPGPEEINTAFDRAMAFANAWKPVSRKLVNTHASKNETLKKGNSTALFLLGKPVGTGRSWWSR
jgi:hypothetical protein